MSPALFAIRLGLARGTAEFRNNVTSVRDLGLGLVTGLIFLGILLLSMNEPAEGMSVSVAALSMPGVLGIMIVSGAVLGGAYSIAADFEDGTLLRAKAVPHGTVGYLTARVVTVSLDTILGLLIVLVPGLFLFDGLATGGAARWFTVAGLVLLGLAATLPWGAMLGAVLKRPGTVGVFGWIPVVFFAVVSGIFEPITQLPWEWVQGIAQVFPVYWLGLGMRSAFLPESAVAVEIGESWRTLEMLGVLGAWAAVGLLLAPLVLRRMARRESGASLESRRQRAMQRIS